MQTISTTHHDLPIPSTTMSNHPRLESIPGFRYRGESPTSSRLSSLTPEPQESHGIALAESVESVQPTTRSGKRTSNLEERIEEQRKRSKVGPNTTQAASDRTGVKLENAENEEGLRERKRRLPRRYIEEEDAQHSRSAQNQGTKLMKDLERRQKSGERRTEGNKGGKASIEHSLEHTDLGTNPKKEIGARKVVKLKKTQRSVDKPDLARPALVIPLSDFDAATPKEAPEDKKPEEAGAWKSHKAGQAVIASLNLDHLSPRHAEAGPFQVRPKRDTRVVGRSSTVATAPLTKEATSTLQPIVEDNGYPSSRFCKVLRLVAGLPPSTRVQRKTTGVQVPAHRPPVWAESRQELCEALPYYRAFQSGLYMSGGVAYGYLLEAFPAPRDIWADGGKVVISHGGGQCVKVDNHSGQSSCVLAADQSPEDARVDTLLQAYKHQTPLVLIAGEGYEQLPWKLGCAYAVLGWYWISAMWVEAEPVAQSIKPPKDRNYFHRYKVRFDWVQSQGSPWWLDEGPSEVLSTRCSPTTLLRDRLKIANLCDGVTIRDPVTGLLTPPITPPQKAATSHNHPVAPFEDASQSREATTLSPTTIHGIPRSPKQGYSALYLLEDYPNSDAESEDSSWREDSPEDDQSWRSRCAPGSQLLKSKDHVAVSQDTESSTHASLTCPSCARHSPRVYREGWICLIPFCSQFWLLDTAIGLVPIPPGFSLTYDLSFLICAPTPGGMDKMPYDVVPDLSELEDDDAGSGALMRGWVCGSCGRANCRYRWGLWECVKCKRIHLPLSTSASTPVSALQPIYSTFIGDGLVHPESSITVEIQSLDGLQVMVYTLPRNRGKIYQVSLRDTSTADELWKEYQSEAVRSPTPLFERRPLKAATIKGALLAQHFAINSGAEYKYNVATSSLPFDRSPACVLRALTLIKTTVNSVLGDDVKFNEILSVMYREGQKMSWHDDGEEGLGPVVASLSLGSPATMSWRPKAQRVTPNQPYYLGHEHKSPKVNPITLLELTLSHGDIVIMQGREMQERYNHRVIPHGYRVAATAREIE